MYEHVDLVDKSRLNLVHGSHSPMRCRYLLVLRMIRDGSIVLEALIRRADSDINSMLLGDGEGLFLYRNYCGLYTQHMQAPIRDISLVCELGAMRALCKQPAYSGAIKVLWYLNVLGQEDSIPVVRGVASPFTLIRYIFLVGQEALMIGVTRLRNYVSMALSSPVTPLT